MTDAGWPWERAIKTWKGFRGGLIDYGTQLLEAEHARAVRIVKRIGKQDVLKRFDHKTCEYAEGYLKACLDILIALQRGRGGKG